MAKLKQKEWMTITDASRMLSEISDNGPVSPTDLLEFAMDREIMLSIRTTKPTDAPVWMAEVTDIREDSKDEVAGHGKLMEQSPRSKQLVMTTVIGNEVFLGDYVHQEPLWPAIWDINTFASGQDFFTRLWNRFQKKMDEDPSHLRPEAPSLIKDGGKTISFSHHIELFNRVTGLVYSVPTHLIPEDSYLGIRRTELQKLFVDDEQRSPETLSSKQYHSLYKMILGMAIEKYGYDPDSRRNTATGENHGSICADLEKAGLQVDADTIREHLKAASAATPPQIKKPNSGNS